MVEKDRNLNDFQMNTFESDKEMPELNDFLSSFKGKYHNILNVNDPIHEKNIKEEYLDEHDSDFNDKIEENSKKTEFLQNKNKEKVFKIDYF